MDVALPAGEIIDTTLGQERVCQVSNSVFVVFLGSDSNGVATHLSEEEISGFRFETLEERFQSLFPNDQSSRKVKLVGSEAVIAKFRPMVPDRYSVKEAPRPEGREIRWIGDGRVLVAKDSSTQVEEQVSQDIRVLIVDDSTTMVKLLSRCLGSVEGITVAGTASNPSQALEMIRELRPDVITLDIHMPEMTGVELYRRYRQEFDIPTIMISSISMEEGPLVLEALQLGAFDYIQKPDVSELVALTPRLKTKIELAHASSGKLRRAQSSGSKQLASAALVSRPLDLDRLVVIGSSTGGTTALEEVLGGLPKKFPPILIAQHIPPVFSKALAERLDDFCALSVCEAQAGDLLEPGRVYIAPGGMQMGISQNDGQYRIRLGDEGPVGGFAPSVEYLFGSVANRYSDLSRVVAVMLTGMGKDGSTAMKKLHDSHARTIAQDEATSVVFGMPKAVIELGAVEKVSAIEKVSEDLLTFLSEKPRSKSKAAS